MQALFKFIPVLLSLALLFSGCAHQTAQQEAHPSTSGYISHAEQGHCNSSYKNELATSQCIKGDSYSQRVYHKHHAHERVRGYDVFAYVVFRIVIEGIVHGLVHH